MPGAGLADRRARPGAAAAVADEADADTEHGRVRATLVAWADARVGMVCGAGCGALRKVERGK